MSNIRDVARAAGVSVATVSRALTNPEKLSKTTLERVQAAVEAMNYRPNLLARNFRSARSYAAVVLVPDITNPFFAQVIQANNRVTPSCWETPGTPPAASGNT